MTRCIGQSCCSDRLNHQAEGHKCEPREVRDAAYLCQPCRSRLGRLLAELPSLHAELGESLASARRRGQGKGRSKGVNLEEIVTRARDHVLAWVLDWSRIVSEERGLHLPAPAMVDTFAHWLGRHVDWLSHQPFADEVLTNLEETHGEARRARQIVPPRRFLLRTPDGRPVACPKRAEGPMPWGAEGHPVCPGMIEATVRVDSPLELRSTLTCLADPSHEWAPSEWGNLGRKLNPAMDEGAARALSRAVGA